MAHPTAVILAVGLTEQMLAHMPRTMRYASSVRIRALKPVFPAVTCTVQSTMLTGVSPRDHGIVANGWFDRDLGEIQFWKQSNRLVQGEKVWETARRRDPSVTTANICWWFNMNTTADFTVTPRPIYSADGRKFPDCHTQPADLRNRLQSELGPFPLFQFWGPGASITSTRWIADATRRIVEWHDPTLSLAYLPHLDYDLQRFGPDGPEAVSAAAALDPVLADLIAFLTDRGRRVLVLSEYGIESVSQPVFPNRALREAGLLAVREERGGEVLDPAASRAFAVCDHQAAHVYVREASDIPIAAEALRSLRGIDRILDTSAQRELGMDHPRAGELVLTAAPGAWFAYPYWLDDSRVPDFARTVDIHRKPGYDPCELLLDPRLKFPKITIARKLLARKLGFRTLLDVIPLNPSLIRGSHGRVDTPASAGPALIGDPRLIGHAGPDAIPCAAVRDIILSHLFDPM